MKLTYKMFKLNEEKLELLCKLKGWKHKCSDLARATGFTRAYVSQVLNDKVPLCHEFMLSYIKVAGMNPENPHEWGSLFYIESGIEKPANHQKNNYAKYSGKKPYEKYSIFGPIRKRDKAAELIRLDVEKPVPAIDYYDDAVPKRPYVKARYGR